MRVETVWFITGVRMPNGKSATSLSIQNRWEKLSLEMTANPEQQLLYIEHRLAPTWVMAVPFSQVKFMHIDDSKQKVTGIEKKPVSKARQRVVRRPDA